ncbi:hypothetical protein [Rhodovulum adriaticum]|uniref:Polysaccharide lyase-like protein n=1 Tax=Rhodovulum adriaticum TaxID=35804 RepID=A0A4R2NXH5_RHOAD|nr:hypothetical protein [Rhodovulum adriaticum]MBK1635219.1 hypothetical protein [Rhodovulum adriaticum]TCP26354.1 hypothetical protein EV656_102319 [Rhodovulum adriaticum]
MRGAGALIAWLALAVPVGAQAVQTLPYDALAPLLSGRADFDDLPALPEPGHNLDHGYATAGARLGERFAGQALRMAPGPENGLHDGVTGRPTAPLTLETGAPDAGLSVSFHRAFRSNAVYPLGPRRWPVPEGRGEGALAIWLARDACAVALRLHTEYVDALGRNADHVGDVTVTFYARDGRKLARLRHAPGGGITGYGYLRAGQTADIAGITVTNLDKGGIALDDIRFGCVPLTG